MLWFLLGYLDLIRKKFLFSSSNGPLITTVSLLINDTTVVRFYRVKKRPRVINSAATLCTLLSENYLVLMSVLSFNP